MEVLARRLVTEEYLVVWSYPGDPELVRLLTVKNGTWSLDATNGHKYILKREAGRKELSKRKPKR